MKIRARFRWPAGGLRGHPCRWEDIHQIRSLDDFRENLDAMDGLALDARF